MTLTKDINGLIFKDSMQPTRITVRMTSDSKGKSLSLADEKENVMLMIPLEPIAKDLKQILNGMEIPKGCQHCAYFRKHMFGNGLDYSYSCMLGATEFPMPWIRQMEERASDCPLPIAQECKVGKCTDCKEYNQEKHYCPKFCDVIRDTTKEMQEFYKGEHEKLEKIEQIMNKESEGYIQNNPCLREIREVLENE